MLLVCCSFTYLAAQESVIFSEEFSTPNLPSDWAVDDISENGARWEFTDTGRATDGQYWDDRPAINSNSGVEGEGGAFMLDSDGAFEANAPYPHHSILTTRRVDCTDNDAVWLQFYQYYRSGLTTTTIGVSNDDGATWTDFPVNEAIGFGVETQNDAFVSLNISSVAANSPDVRVRFEFEGINYFWIIDDVRLVQPEIGINNPLYPETYPAELGDSLSAWGIPHEIDPLGGAYVPNELVVQWVDGLTDAEKQETRDDLGVARFDTCSCSELELFIFPTFLTSEENLLTNGDFSDGDTGFTSDLNSDCMCNTDSYCVGTQMVDKCNNFGPFNFEEFIDPGVGQFMIVDGPTVPNRDIWCNTVQFEPNDDYVFTFRAREFAGGPNPILELTVGGTAIGTATIGNTGDWEQFNFSFTNSQGAISLDVCLTQTNNGSLGYDYGLDDLFMANLDAAGLIYQDSIEEKKDKAKTMPAKVEEAEFNYYNFDIEELKDTLPLVSTPYPVNENTQEGDFGDDMLIAILDTGIDYNYAFTTPGFGFFDISPYMWESPRTSTCYPNDDKGWNFVHFNDTDKQDKPFDDHGHGTHVAGIVVQQWEQFRQLSETTIDGCCNLKLLPVKTHDFHGLGKLFDVSCGIVYAAEMGADVINASWGFTAVQDPDDGILHYAIDYANDEDRNVLLVTSAGNTGVNIDAPVGAPTTPNYPSNYNLNNIVTVAALDSADVRWPFSNFSPTTVHYAVPGVGIQSSIPLGASITDPTAIWEPKSGTSMAAPVVSAYAGALFCMDDILDEQEVKAKLNTYSVPTLADWSTLSITGKKMDAGTFIANLDFQQCLTAVSETLSAEAQVSLYPNPTADLLTLSISDNQVPIRLLLLSDGLGRTIWQERVSGAITDLNRTINLSQFPSGIYQLSIFTGQGIQGFSVLRQ